MAIRALRALQQYILREVLKDAPKGVMQTLPNKDLIELNVQVLAQRLMQAGIDPTTLKNANQVENAVKMIESRPAVQEGITATKSAKIMDMEGKEIDPRSKIMGGKQAETDAQIKARLDKGNKEGIARIKNKKMVKDAIDNVSPGFVRGDRKYNAQLVAEDLAEKKFGKEFYDLDQRQQMDLYDEALEGLSEQTRGMPDPDDFAQGGRAGFDNGGMGNMIAAGATAEDIKRMQDAEFQNKINQYFNIKGEFKKPGKKQIKGAPEGVTIDREAYDFLVDARVPLSEKIDLLARFGRQKERQRLEFDDQEILFGERGSRQRGIGAGINLDAKKGLSGSLMYDPDTGRKTAGIKYKFNKGGIARLGFKDGMTRRTFLKILGGAMAIPIVGKFLKPLKTAKGVTKVPMIKTDDVAGKPEWFDQLVNKVIVEGDDVTKRFATGERQSIHQKTLDDGSVVRVTEDVDDGAVRVEYESKESMFGEPVQMQYKKPKPDEGDPRPAAEFEVAESGIVGRADGPDDFYLEAEEVGGSSIRDLDSDVSKLKQYATGKGPTMKEIVEIKKRKDKVKKLSEGDPDATSQYITNRQGDYDPSPDDFASGGIARMLGE